MSYLRLYIRSFLTAATGSGHWRACSESSLLSRIAVVGETCSERLLAALLSDATCSDALEAVICSDSMNGSFVRTADAGDITRYVASWRWLQSIAATHSANFSAGV